MTHDRLFSFYHDSNNIQRIDTEVLEGRGYAVSSVIDETASDLNDLITHLMNHRRTGDRRGTGRRGQQSVSTQPLLQTHYHKETRPGRTWYTHLLTASH